MTQCFEKARELGTMIAESELAVKAAEAKANYEADGESVKAMDEYKAYQENIRQSMEAGVLTKEAFAEATKRINEMTAELKKIPLISELLKAENEYNFFVNQIVGILRTAITGELEDGCGGECGGCAGCGH